MGDSGGDVFVEPKGGPNGSSSSTATPKPKPKIGPKSKVKRPEEWVEVRHKPRIGPKSKVQKTEDSDGLPQKPPKPKIGPKSKVKRSDEDLGVLPKRPKIGPKSKVKRTEDSDDMSRKSSIDSDSDVEIVSARSDIKPKIRHNDNSSTSQRSDRKVSDTPVRIKTDKNTEDRTPKTRSKVKPKVYPKIEPKVEPKSEPKVRPKIDPKPHPIIDVRDEEVKSKSLDDEIEMNSMRNIPHRKAFKEASTSIKQKPQPMYRVVPSSTPTNPTTSGSQPKRKPKPKREATEPVDTFSPIIVLDRIIVDKHFNTTPTEAKEQLFSLSPLKQSARKTFSNKSQKRDNTTTATTSGSNGKTVSETKVNGISDSLEEKTEKPKSPTISFDELEPLTVIPSVGDLIAFKMLTLSSDGLNMEASPFNVGSVVCADSGSQMVDILLKNSLQRTNYWANDYSRDDMSTDIISLKINWTTVLEPKLIQTAIH
ncbi:unnamed protein product [Oppiella nova]|uniref:Coilin tudor domain-containing protein n=1 Tax=Oppiella nova TaxID=334625 RepID=A0A7R9QTH2_9ACAR|nr:unnamed protein product [Oppiella nova]CAG2175079.1 unnamed protein product [Oppiella nova]